MADFTEANRKYFDQKVAAYKTDFAEVTNRLSKEIGDRRHWISSKWSDTEAGKGQEIKLLEYACGPGTASLTLEPFVTKIVGLDISDKMIDEFNKNAREAGVSPEKMIGLKGDLLAETLPEHLSGPSFFDFDIVVVSFALHHFADPELALKRLGDRLKKGGVCLTVDFVPDHSHHHGHDEIHQHSPEAAATIKKHGFTRDEMQKLYEDAGLGAGFDFKAMEEPVEFTVKDRRLKKKIFIARGERL